MKISPLYFFLLIAAPFLQAQTITPSVNATRNERKVADNLNTLSLSGALANDPSLLNAYNSLLTLSENSLNQALNQLQPSPFSTFAEIQAAVGGQILTIFHRKPTPYCYCSSPFRIWTEPYGNWLEEKNLEGQIGFTANSKGLTIGFDGEIFEGWVVGAGAAWNDSHLHWKNGIGKGSVNGYYGAFYTDYSTENFYVGASILAGLDHFTTSRHIRFSTIDTKAHSRYYGTEIMGQLATAVFFGPSMCFAFPYFNLDFFYLKQNGAEESGASGLNLEVAPNGETTVRTEAGFAIQVSDTNKNNTFCISPLFSLGWSMECPIDRPNYSATFEGQTTSFQASGWDYTWQLFVVRFGLTFTYKCCSLFGGYVAEMSPLHRTPYFDQRGNIHFDVSW